MSAAVTSDKLANVLETVANKEHQRGLLMGLAVAVVGFGVYQATRQQPNMGSIPTNTRAGGGVSTQPGSTRYDPRSDYLPGYGPGDRAGSYI